MQAEVKPLTKLWIKEPIGRISGNIHENLIKGEVWIAVDVIVGASWHEQWSVVAWLSKRCGHVVTKCAMIACCGLCDAFNNTKKYKLIWNKSTKMVLTRNQADLQSRIFSVWNRKPAYSDGAITKLNQRPALKSKVSSIVPFAHFISNRLSLVSLQQTRFLLRHS